MIARAEVAPRLPGRQIRPSEDLSYEFSSLLAILDEFTQTRIMMISNVLVSRWRV